MMSCSETVEEEIIDCEFTEDLCDIIPFCTWPPSPNATISLPIAFRYNGGFAPHEEFTFLWSSDPDFGGSAISVEYDDLPVTVVVTEKSTGCIVELTLAAN